MSDNIEIIPRPKTRLKFIDMARSAAILLMLEGHFIEHTFKDFKPMVHAAQTEGTSGYLLFDWFYFMKGFTAPLFFTVTGIVFVYLLARNKDAGYFRNPRVKKGFSRVLELLFWGYALQLAILTQYENYFNLEFGAWVSAFHVLQCIGMGIASLLLIYGLYKLVRFIPLFVWYFIAGTVLLCFYHYMKALAPEHYLPEGAPSIIQNIIKGPNSVFPLVPWMAFTLYGGMLGAIIARSQEQVKKYWFPLLFMAIGIILNLWPRPIFLEFDALLGFFGLDNVHFVDNSSLFTRFGQILIALGIFMLIEKIFDPKAELFLKVGQNTLPIYVIHVIILYGGLLGYGLKSFMMHSLPGWGAVLGAVIFIATFVMFIKYLDFFVNIWNKVLNTIFFWRKKRTES